MLWDHQLKPLFPPPGLGLLPQISRMFQARTVTLQTLLLGFSSGQAVPSQPFSPAGSVVPSLPHDTPAVWMACSLFLPKQRLQVFGDEL